MCLLINCFSFLLYFRIAAIQSSWKLPRLGRFLVGIRKKTKTLWTIFRVEIFNKLGRNVQPRQESNAGSKVCYSMNRSFSCTEYFAQQRKRIERKEEKNALLHSLMHWIFSLFNMAFQTKDWSDSVGDHSWLSLFAFCQFRSLHSASVTRFHFLLCSFFSLLVQEPFCFIIHGTISSFFPSIFRNESRLEWEIGLKFTVHWLGAVRPLSSCF